MRILKVISVKTIITNDSDDEGEVFMSEEEDEECKKQTIGKDDITIVSTNPKIHLLNKQPKNGYDIFKIKSNAKQVRKRKRKDEAFIPEEDSEEEDSDGKDSEEQDSEREDSNTKCKKQSIGKNDIKIVSTDVETNVLDTGGVVRGMTGRLIHHEGKTVEFEVRNVHIKNKDGKHFISYINKDIKPDAELLDLDIKNFVYKSYGKKWRKGWCEGIILSLNNADGSEFKNCQPVIKNSSDENQDDKNI